MRLAKCSPVLAPAVLAVAVLIGPGRLPGPGPAPGGPKGETAPGPALKGLDPVALTKGKQVPGDKALALTHNGYRYLFATQENRKAFEREPARYRIQLDGR